MTRHSPEPLDHSTLPPHPMDDLLRRDLQAIWVQPDASQQRRLQSAMQPPPPRRRAWRGLAAAALLAAGLGLWWAMDPQDNMSTGADRFEATRRLVPGPARLHSLAFEPPSRLGAGETALLTEVRRWSSDLDLATDFVVEQLPAQLQRFTSRLTRETSR